MGIVHYKYLLGPSQKDSNDHRTPAHSARYTELVTHHPETRSSGFQKDREVLMGTRTCQQRHGSQQAQRERAASD